MTVTHEPARLNTTGSPRPLPVTREKGPDIDHGSPGSIRPSCLW